jgi:hypothetical protein
MEIIPYLIIWRIDFSFKSNSGKKGIKAKNLKVIANAKQKENLNN